jgi:hypothetical protein
MPYITNAQKERLAWRDLEFAIHLIRTADRCDKDRALYQLRLAIADGNVQVSWGDRPRQYVDEPVFDTAVPPADAWWWLEHAEFDLEGRDSSVEDAPDNVGLLKDDWCLAPLSHYQPEDGAKWPAWEWISENEDKRLSMVVENRIRFRPLLVRREMLLTIWNWPWPLEPDADERRPLPLKRPAPVDEIRAVLRKIYAQHRDPPNMNDAYKLAQPRLRGTPRDTIRRILKEKEFASLRLGRGERKIGR